MIKLKSPTRSTRCVCLKLIVLQKIAIARVANPSPTAIRNLEELGTGAAGLELLKLTKIASAHM